MPLNSIENQRAYQALLGSTVCHLSTPTLEGVSRMQERMHERIAGLESSLRAPAAAQIDPEVITAIVQDAVKAALTEFAAASVAAPPVAQADENEVIASGSRRNPDLSVS